MRTFASVRPRPGVSTAALPVAEESGHGTAVAASGVRQPRSARIPKSRQTRLRVWTRISSATSRVLLCAELTTAPARGACKLGANDLGGAFVHDDFDLAQESRPRDGVRTEKAALPLRAQGRSDGRAPETVVADDVSGAVPDARGARRRATTARWVCPEIRVRLGHRSAVDRAAV